MGYIEAISYNPLANHLLTSNATSKQKEQGPQSSMPPFPPKK